MSEPKISFEDFQYRNELIKDVLPAVSQAVINGFMVPAVVDLGQRYKNSNPHDRKIEHEKNEQMNNIRETMVSLASRMSIDIANQIIIDLKNS